MSKITFSSGQAIVVIALNVFLALVVLLGSVSEEPTVSRFSGTVDRSKSEVIAVKSKQIIPSKPSPDQELVGEIEKTLIGSFGLNDIRAKTFAGWLHKAHEESGVPVGYMVALVATESSFRYEVTSHAGAIGPAQVIPRFWEKWCDADLTDPQENIICGAKVLAHYRARCDDWSCAFKKYNVGPSGYRQAEFIGAMQRYIAKIDRNLKIAGGFEFIKKG